MFWADLGIMGGGKAGPGTGSANNEHRKVADANERRNNAKPPPQRRGGRLVGHALLYAPAPYSDLGSAYVFVYG